MVYKQFCEMCGLERERSKSNSKDHCHKCRDKLSRITKGKYLSYDICPLCFKKGTFQMHYSLYRSTGNFKSVSHSIQIRHTKYIQYKPKRKRIYISHGQIQYRDLSSFSKNRFDNILNKLKANNLYPINHTQEPPPIIPQRYLNDKRHCNL